MMRGLGRFVPLAAGVGAAAVIAAVAAVALPGDAPAAPVVEADQTPPAQEAPEVTDVAAAPASPVEPAPKAPVIDVEAVKAAHDSFPKQPKAERDKAAATHAAKVETVKQREAEELAKKEAEQAAADRKAAEKKAADQVATDKKAAEKKAADQAAADKKAAEKTKQEVGKEDKHHEKPKTENWWPEHVWAHVVSCTADLDAGSITATWDVWIKHGGDWQFVSASPAPSSQEMHGSDKLKLVYPSASATIKQQQDGWAKAHGGQVSVTVAKAGDASTTKTYTVDRWVKVTDDGHCH